jgi:hypothetical protein
VATIRHMSMVQASLQQPADVDMGITGALHASTLVGYEFSTFAAQYTNVHFDNYTERGSFLPLIS